MMHIMNVLKYPQCINANEHKYANESNINPNEFINANDGYNLPCDTHHNTYFKCYECCE